MTSTPPVAAFAVQFRIKPALHGAAVDFVGRAMGPGCAPWGGRGFRGARHGAGLRAMGRRWISWGAPWGRAARHGAAM
ncbi:MAG: hypothetical protein OXG98_03490, partial [Gemmatimonadetes bacterium]|nr:hypothetical protein [Gemmatimonadota bacterium]